MKAVQKSGLLILIFAVICGLTPLLAQTTSMEDDARRIWLENNSAARGVGDVWFDRITPNGDLVVFEKFNPPSFIILARSGKENQLVGYSFDNLFFGDESVMSCQPELLEAIASVAREDPSRLKGTRVVTSSIGPMIRTRWGQGHYFNYYCPRDPLGPNGRVYAGCVAVAIGQIVRYYGMFNSIELQHAYQSGHYGNLSSRIGPYDWTLMEDNPITVDLAVSDFLYDLGVLLHMTYGASGSTTNSHRALEVLHELGYTGAIIQRKSKFSSASWAELFYQNLSEYKPVMVTGGGHAFVCDGYNLDGLFHFNLGWDGYGDGYYPISCVMSMPVTEAFTELEPLSWPHPPKSISRSYLSGETFVSWSYEQGQRPLLSRIYSDGRLIRETADTLFNTGQLSPGIHILNVSAVYPDGESRWIGPVDVFVRGARLVVGDQILYSIFQRSLGYEISDVNNIEVYEGDLSRIISLEIDQPVSSMEGLGLCNHLRRLIIDGSPGPALDAGPLEDLSGLRVLEWTGRPMTNPGALAKLSQLAELRFRNAPLESLGFLESCPNIMKFECSDVALAFPHPIESLPLLDELVLSRTNLRDASFISRIPQLIRLDLSGNELTETGFLSNLSKLEWANLSGNKISNLLLTDQLQSLQKLDVSNNDISRITITADLKLLRNLDLSGNKLTTPGRLFLYTPALADLDLSQNLVRDMGKQRCQNLEAIDVSHNQLITSDWISLQPRLKKVNAEHNRISDLSALVRNNLFRQLDFLGLDKNPLSRQSFQEWLPLLVEAIDKVTRPQTYQPLSPCYLSPADGSRLTDPQVELRWLADNSSQDCVFDLFLVSGDTLVPLLSGLDSCKAVLPHPTTGSFSWVVASRTADSVYYSGVSGVISTIEWPVPLKEGFESYREGESLSAQSDCWMVNDKNAASEPPGRIVTSCSRTGMNSLELAAGESAVLSMQHLVLPYVYIRFSALIPPGQQGEFRVQNMNGMHYRIVWEPTGLGKFYVNEKLFGSFTIDHINWTDYEIAGHARNNNVHFKAGNQLLMNDIWLVPEGVIRTDCIQMLSGAPDTPGNGSINRIYFDDVSITSATCTSTDDMSMLQEPELSVYPNPFADHIELSFAESGHYPVVITDAGGREVFRQMIYAVANSENVVYLSGLVPGIYFLKAGSSKCMRIIKSPPVY